MKAHRSPMAWILLFASIGSLMAQEVVNVDVNLDMKHAVGGVSSFEREKFITIHASLTESDWNNAEDKLDYLMNDLDVYFGRDNGGVNWWSSQVTQDPSRPGYANPSSAVSQGKNQLSAYKNNSRKQYDHKADVMIGGQTSAMWPAKQEDWSFVNADAVGDWMGMYLNNFYRAADDDDVNNGHPQPRFLEVLNEPLYELIDDSKLLEEEKSTPLEVFRFHRDVARAVKRRNTQVKVGGYTTAFPEFDVDNFQRWEQRMKLFIDSAGADMDFYSIHLYDFNRHWKTGNKHHIHFKGSRTEATFDMMEQYGMLKYGSVKPMLISEYSGRDHSMENKPWFPERDWMVLKALSPMLMSFIDRPDKIVKTIPFIVNRAEWGRSDAGIPYGPRLQRQRFEAEGETGNDWVFTELVKFYELWSDVKGTRVDSWSDNPDVKSETYVDGNKAYVIFSNLNFDPLKIHLNLSGQNGNTVTEIKVKHLHAVNNLPVLEESSLESFGAFLLDSEATAIVEYTFATDVDINHTLDEVKHYASSYYQPIIDKDTIQFEIKDVEKGDYGEGELRVAFGRAHDKSQNPVVLLNGTALNVPENFSGATQEYRESGFFGLLEIPVPYDLIHESNIVKVIFPDAGGYVSTVTLRSFSMSRKVQRSNSVSGVSLYPSNVELGISQIRELSANIVPLSATDVRLVWSSSDASKAIVDEKGRITGVSEGVATIKVKTNDGDFTDSCLVRVQSDRVPVVADSVIISPASADLIVGESLQVSAKILPLDVDDNTLSWTSTNTAVATVSTNGLINALGEGATEIKAIAQNGKEAVCKVVSIVKIPGQVLFDDRSKYINASYSVDGEIELRCNFTATTGTTVGNNGIKFWLREMKSNWSVVKDYVAYDKRAAGKSSGTASASISLQDLTPTKELPTGNFYFLYLTFDEEDGNRINGQGANPITILGGTALSENHLANLQLYPNPTSNVLHISSDRQFTSARLYSVTGSLCQSLLIGENKIDLSSVTEGIYFIELQDSKCKTVRRITIQR